MVNFVIAGKVDCENFRHAYNVAAYLEKNLPNFQVRKIELDAYDWKKYIMGINKQYTWHHYASPLVYKELVSHGGLPHLIGGISEFWEYCYSYYGLESLIAKEELEKLAKDNMAFHNMDTELKSMKEPRKILIYGSVTKFLYLLLPELLKIEEMLLPNGIEIFFYNNLFDYEESNYEDLIGMMNQDYNIKTEKTDDLEDGLLGCELLIITGCYSQHEESMKYVIMMNYLADEINHFARRYLKVLFANHGVSCYMASILASKLNTPNIAVVTSDHGLGPLNYVAGVLDMNLDELCGPPVWGFVGNNEVIDVSSIIKKCNMYKPYVRSTHSHENSTLVHGTVTTELRFINYLIKDVPRLLIDTKSSQAAAKKAMHNRPVYSKVSATINLLQLWFSTKPTNDIISLGVVSDGSYGIPNGLVFSQPAIMDNGIWRPFPNYPVPSIIKGKIKHAVAIALKVLKS